MTRAFPGGVIAAACLPLLSLAAASPALAQQPQAQPPAKPAAPAPAKAPEDTTKLSGVTVSGARKEIETSIDRRSYSVANDLQGKTGNISDVLRNVPSVQVDVNGNVSLRGDGNVTVLMDGRPSALLSKETLAQALQSLPADQIDRIEVITNPSAEFRADGAAGIINLVTKKARGAGRTGSVRLNAQSTGSAGASVTNGFNSNKVSSVQSLSYNHARIGLDGVSVHTQPDPAGGTSELTDLITGEVNANALQGRASVDYDYSKKTRLTATLAGSWQEGTQSFDDTLTQLNGAGLVTNALTRQSIQDIHAVGVQSDANLRHVFGDAHDLNLHAALGVNGNDNDRIDLTTRTLPAAPGFAQSVTRSGDNVRATLSADFQKPLTGGVQFKAGYLFEYLDNEINHGGGFGPAANAIVRDPAQTDVFADTEGHHQAYVTAQKTFGKWTALGGLRAEAVNLDLDQKTLDIQNSQDYARLYPTLHLDRGIGDGKKLTASYSKRVQRPGPPDLDPFRYSASTSAVIEGNPNLKPQETDSYEVGYESRKGQGATLITLYRRESGNAFSAILTDLGNGVLLQRRENVGQQSNTGIEIVRSNRINAKLTYNLSGNVYQTELSAQNLGFTTKASGTVAFGRANLNWQVTPKDFVQLNVFANGKQVLPQGYAAPVVSGNIGYRRNLTDKVSLMLVVQDPFDSLNNKIYLNTGIGKDRRLQHQDSRVASLTLVWNFAGKPPAAAFDFAPGGAGATAVP